MKRKLRMLIRCGIMLVALAIPLRGLSKMMQRKASVITYRPFYEQDEDFDVLFMGASVLLNGVYPMELWKDYGIVSYNLAGYGNVLPTTYWVMHNALEYTTPKLIVIDCLFLGFDTKVSPRYSHLHRALDSVPLSLTKIAAVFDLLNDPVSDELVRSGRIRDSEKRTPLGLLWDFSVYHENWTGGSKDWFVVNTSKEKGAEIKTEVVAADSPVKCSFEKSKLEEDTVAVEYLERIITECQRRGIEVLLTYMPMDAPKEKCQEANRVYDIAEEFGVNYINYLEMSITDFSTDYMDSNTHLNASGARKVTDYLGRYIMEHYDIPDQRNNPQYSGWYEDYADYEEFKKELLKEQEELDSYLMLLADKNVDALIELDDPALWKDQKYVNLLRNLGADISELEDGAGSILIDGSERVAQCIPCDPSQEYVYDTILGKLRIEWGEEGEREVLLNEQACVTASPDDGAGIRICALKGDSGERIDEAAFSFAVQERLGKYELSEPLRL